MGGGQGSFEILPLHKEFGEGWKSFSQSEGWHNKFWGSFYMEVLSFSYIGGGTCKVLPCLEGGGGRKKFRAGNFSIL